MNNNNNNSNNNNDEYNNNDAIMNNNNNNILGLVLLLVTPSQPLILSIIERLSLFLHQDASFNNNKNHSSRFNNNKCEKYEALKVLVPFSGRASVVITIDDSLHQVPPFFTI